MTDDDKALVERLEGWARDAFEGRKLIGGYRDILLAGDRIEALSAENERRFYAGHDDSCDCVKGWAKGPCNCGYTETWKQWSAALGETK